MVQDSFPPSSFQDRHITPSNNGLVWTAYHAYNNHYHLVLRPEDIWFAILTQLSFFINAHAEELRSFFVPHEGKKELEAFSNIADFGYLAQQMTDLIAKNVNDPSLREWVMPAFTTTTWHDLVVGAVLFMGAMQSYFEYKMTITCGLPFVTLLGEVEDWKEIRKRLDKIDLLGDEPRQFASMLRPILDHMVLSFESPTDEQVSLFWNTIVHHNHVGSGTDYVSGWLTAFCFWDDEGQAKRLNHEVDALGDVRFPTVDIDAVPAGVASVPVKVDQHGHKYNATMVAGSVGIDATGVIGRGTGGSNVTSAINMALQIDQLDADALNTQLRATDNDARPEDTVQPVTGWWIYENEPVEEAEAREAEIKKLKEDLDAVDAEIRANIGARDLSRERLDESMRLSHRLQELEAF
jgi:hypothetical protein